MKKLYVFTDGACSMNKTWTGGWSYLIHRRGKPNIIAGGYEYNSTNNRMEVYAIIAVLKRLRYIENKYGVKYQLQVISDSGYAVFPFIRYNWIDKWKLNLFNRDMPNYGLWEELIPLVLYFQGRVRFIHIRGHGKNKNEFHNHYNDIVDKYAVNMRIEADTII